MLTQSVGYAASALGYLAGSGRHQMLVRELAEAVGVPGPYLAKIMNQLARRGFVTTQRGIGGGVALARAAGEISLYDLCEALDDPVVQQRCMLGIAECTDERSCPAHRFWSRVRSQQTEFLVKTTLVDMARFENARQFARAKGAGIGGSLLVKR
jgi:Rrf2 family iron-sulfur cluster assembly transcriptional regulator